MKPAPFDYHTPASLPEALELLQELGGEAAPLAGGQSLAPFMNLRLARPAHLVDLNRLSDLAYLRHEDSTIKVGALVRHAEMERSNVVREALPIAPHVVPFIGYPAIRHRGTVVGSIAHADPAAEWPCLSLALDAQVTLTSTTGARVVPADEFFVSFLTTVREPQELLTEVSFSTRFDAWGFQEFARRSGDFALVAAAAALRTSEGRVVDARISLAGASGRPVRIPDAEEALEGRPLSREAAGEAASIASVAVDPPEDIHGSTGFRQKLVHTMVERALSDAESRMNQSRGQ